MSVREQLAITKSLFRALVEKKIKRSGSKWCVYSEDGSKNLGCYDTKTEAVERLRQIEGHKTEKGIPGYWYRDTGLHVHSLTREKKITKADGAHAHIFLLDDEEYRYMLISDEDGIHSHVLAEDVAEVTNVDGSHQHIVPLIDGIVTKTTVDGDHAHTGLQVYTSAFDGVHTHKLVLPNGQELISLTGGQMWEKLEGKTRQEHNEPMPPASYLAELSDRACSVLDYIGREMHKERHAFSAAPPDSSSTASTSANSSLLMASVPAKLTKQNREVRIVKAEEDEEKEERIVFGVVLVPNDVDAQGDIYDAEEVRKAAYSFMEIFGGHYKIMHKGEHLDKSAAAVLETYLSKTEETHGNETFPIGTWFMTTRVKSDDLWDEVKKGTWTGYSIGGSAIKESLTN